MADSSVYLMRNDYCLCSCHRWGNKSVVHNEPCCKECQYCSKDIKMENHPHHEEMCRDRRVRVVNLNGELLFRPDFSDTYFNSISAYTFNECDRIYIHRDGSLLNAGYISVDERSGYSALEGLDPSFFKNPEDAQHLLPEFMKEGDEIVVDIKRRWLITDLIEVQFESGLLHERMMADIRKANPDKSETDVWIIFGEAWNKIIPEDRSSVIESMGIEMPEARVLRERRS